MATVTTGIPAASSSFRIGCDSESGGGRITPSTSVVRKRRVASRLLVRAFATRRLRGRGGSPRCARAFERADQELAEIGGARIGVEHADMGRLAGGEVSRGLFGE